jgi:hypothetical protein
MQTARRFDLALQAGAVEGVLQVVRAHLIASWPTFAAYDIGGPQLLSGTPLAASRSSRGSFNISDRTVSASPRQIASVMRQAVTSRGQLASP